MNSIISSAGKNERPHRNANRLPSHDMNLHVASDYIQKESRTTKATQLPKGINSSRRHHLASVDKPVNRKDTDKLLEHKIRNAN